MNPECVVCGKVITWAFYLCTDCEATWGKRKADQDEWLQYLIRSERKKRYAFQRDKERMGQVHDWEEHLPDWYVEEWDVDRFI